MAFNVIQIGLQISQRFKMLFNILASVMSLLFLAFLIICCSYAYPSAAQLCMVHSFAGRVLWWYATIALILIGIAVLIVSAIAICIGCLSEVENPDAESSVLVDGGSVENYFDEELIQTRD